MALDTLIFKVFCNPCKVNFGNFLANNSSKSSNIITNFSPEDDSLLGDGIEEEDVMNEILSEGF